MTEESEQALRARKAALAVRLVESTGISKSEALELISILGSDWSSLVREAKLLPRKR